MTTYLTRVPQHDLRLRAGRAEDSPDTRHRDVMSIFGELDGNARDNAGAVFRLERYPNRPPAYLVRSRVRPMNLPGETELLEETSLLVPSGTPVSFRVSVNAVQRTKKGVRPVYADGALEQLLEDEDSPDATLARGIEITPWLAEKLSPALTEVHLLNHQREVVGSDRSGRRSKGSAKVVQIDTVDGVGIVDDSVALQHLLEKGVGRAKSYGCGLLTVRPL